jgi:hypothetical protein
MSAKKYIEEFISYPDYDLTSPVASQFFFQEGGFARFITVSTNVAPTVYSPPLPQVQVPNLESHHELWNNVTNNAFKYRQLNIQGEQLGIQKDQLEFQREKHEWDKAYNQALLDFKKEEFEQGKVKFQFDKMISQASLINTFTDKLSGLNFPLYRKEDYALKAEEYDLDQAVEDMQSQDPNTVLRGVSQVTKFTNDPAVRTWATEKAQDDKAIAAFNALPPEMLPFVNNAGEFINAAVSGTSAVPKLDIDSETYSEYAKSKIDGTLAKNRAETYFNEQKAQKYQIENKLIGEITDDALSKYEALKDSDPEAATKILDQAVLDINAKMSKDPNVQVAQGLWGNIDKQGILGNMKTDEEKIDFIFKVITAERQSTVSYANPLDPNGGFNKKNPLGLDAFSLALTNGFGSSENFGKFVSVAPGLETQLSQSFGNLSTLDNIKKYNLEFFPAGSSTAVKPYHNNLWGNPVLDPMQDFKPTEIMQNL